jgi:hypothetical protein
MDCGRSGVLEEMKAIVALLLILTAGMAAQNRHLVPVSESDVRWAVVKDEIDRITRINPTSPVANRLGGFGRIDGKASRALFPAWEFFSFTYSNYLRDGFTSGHASLAFGLGHTLAVSSDGTAAVRLYYDGNYEQYGDLLLKSNVTMADARAARRIWDAFNEIHMKGWSALEPEKRSTGEWRLGRTRYDQTISVVGGRKTVVTRTHYVKVKTDPATHRITSWESVVETSNERVERERNR